MTYSTLHRFLLRAIASRGVLAFKDVEKLKEEYPESDICLLYPLCTNKPHKYERELITKDIDFTGAAQNIQLQHIVQEINDEIRPYQQEIKITTNEVTNEEVLVFMSLGYDDATKSQNVFSASELEFFRVLIEQIMTTECRQITAVHATKLIKSLSKTDAQKLLNTWCRMYYLEKEGNNYALGVRAIHEFESYLRENMPDTIEECSLCKKIVFRGYNCPGCVLAIHTRCLKNYLDKIQKWPCCKMDFNAEQLEEMNRESSRFEQTQQMPATQSISATQHGVATQQSMAYDVIDVPENEESPEDVEMIREEISETSQRISRKRKRAIID